MAKATEHPLLLYNFKSPEVGLFFFNIKFTFRSIRLRIFLQDAKADFWNIRNI